jgi:hypothetical protein
MLRVNAYGLRKARRFRARFNLEPFNAYSAYGDVHDYLHTVIGALLVWHDECKVLDLECAIELGYVPLPRGLELAATDPK